MLHAPSILVSGKTSFKNVQLDSKISDFVENSLKLSEFLVSSNFLSGNGTHQTPTNVTDEWLSFYTVYFGSCHKLELDVMVSKSLKNCFLNGDKDLQLSKIFVNKNLKSRNLKLIFHDKKLLA